MCKENRIDITLRYLLKILTVIQTAFAVVWIFGNIGGFQEDYLALNYCNAAGSLVVDDYMGILYAVFVRIFGRHWALYIVQAGIVFYSAYLMSGSFWVGAFITTNPCVLQSTFTVLPNSLILSMLFFFLFLFTKRCRRSTGEKAIIAGGIALAMGLMDPDWGYLIIALSIIPFILAFFVKKMKKARGILFIAMLAALICIPVNNRISTPGSYGRVERTLDYCAFQRIVWPDVLRYQNVADAYYGNLSEEMVKASKTPELVGMELGNRIIELQDKDTLRDFFQYTVKDTLSKGKKYYIPSIVEDYLHYLFAPLSTVRVLANEKSGTLIQTEMSLFMFELPVLSRLFFVFSLLSCSLLTLCWVVYAIIGAIKRWHIFNNGVLLITIYLMLFISAYETLFATRGFSYRNALFMIVMWPLLSFISQEGKTE